LNSVLHVSNGQEVSVSSASKTDPSTRRFPPSDVSESLNDSCLRRVVSGGPAVEVRTVTLTQEVDVLSSANAVTKFLRGPYLS
jgi:hypothetical protein